MTSAQQITEAERLLNGPVTVWDHRVGNYQASSLVLETSLDTATVTILENGIEVEHHARCMSATGTATGASSCLTPRQASTSGTGVPTATGLTTRISGITIPMLLPPSNSGLLCTVLKSRTTILSTSATARTIGSRCFTQTDRL